MDRIRIGVTGIGYMGQLEARICNEMQGFEVVGLHNRSPEKAHALAQELGCGVCETLDDLLALDLQALVVATPNNAHLEPVTKAAQRGLHIFLEKPMGLHVQECREMLQAAQEAGVQLFMGHPQRFMDGARAVREAVLGGDIGRPVALRVERTFWVDTHHKAPGWKTQKSQSGGHLFHHMHEIDTARWILGDVASVFARMDNLAHLEAEDGEEDVVQISLRYAQGALGTFELGSAYRKRSHFLRIDGSEGTALIDWQAEGGGEVSIWGRNPFSQARGSGPSCCENGLRPHVLPMYADPECQASAAECYAAMAKGQVHGSDKWGAPLFLRRLVERELECYHHLITGGQVEPDLRGLAVEDGLRAVEIAQAACQSAAESRVVDLPL